MSQTQPSPQEDYRQSYLRHLVNRIEAVELRIERFRREGWDLGQMAQLREDVHRLAGSAGRYELPIPAQRLLLLEQTLADQVALRRLPDKHQANRMVGLLGMVNTALSALPEYRRIKAAAQLPPVDPEALAAIGGPSFGQSGSAPRDAGPPKGDPRSDAARSAAFGFAESRRVYLVGEGSLVADVGKRLGAGGFEVETVDNAADLTDLLMCVSPEGLVVDASRYAELGAVGKARRAVLERSVDKDVRIRLVALAPLDNLQSRLEARRAGVETLIFPPFNAADLVRRLQAELAPPAEDAVRVLIVEDDRSQALFAQSVLANAGMEARVELEAMRVLEALDAFHPDMILMDLHMPEANGVELTELIRDHQEYMDTPIVFLTGENDPEARSLALEAGGDDFLSKPIRPKALVAAVQGRVRRRRAIARRDRQLGARDQGTGLYRRSFVFDRINDALGAAADERSEVGGVLLLEVDDAEALRQRLGLVAFERVLASAGRVFAAAIGDRNTGALISDHAFVVLAPDFDDERLVALGERLREDLAHHKFSEAGRPVALTATAGICPLRYGFDDASALIDIAARTCRDARAAEQGILLFEPDRATDRNPEASLAQQLREAIQAGNFSLVFQPIAAMQGGEESQYQTLLSMRDAMGRRLPAAEFLPLAERAGLMIDIDRWALARAMAILDENSYRPGLLRLFVPQALTSLVAQGQDTYLKKELASRGLQGSSLVLECRLADALLNPPGLGAFARSMQGTGLQICLSQFEHTPEAASLLGQMPLGFVKLAPKFVADHVPQAVRDELRVLTEHAHRLGIHVIGHRVEDQQTAATLWLAGIDYLQGNFVHNVTDKLDYDFQAAVV